jgi:hypothetical protein
MLIRKFFRSIHFFLSSATASMPILTLFATAFRSLEVIFRLHRSSISPAVLLKVVAGKHILFHTFRSRCAKLTIA